MLIFRALFWVVAVSLLLAGGNGFSNGYGDRPGSEYVGRDSPAYHSAQRIVASVSKLDGWCLSHETVCSAASTTGHLGLALVDGSVQQVVKWASSEQTVVAGVGGADQLRDAVPLQDRTGFRDNATSEEYIKTQFLDGLSDLLYSENEELDDIG